MTLSFLTSNLTKRLCVISFVLLLSCSSTSKLVYKTKTDSNRVRFFTTNVSNHRKGLSDFYVQVDSSNVRIYYSFFISDVNKTYDDHDNIQFILTSDKQSMSPLTKIDSFVLANADELMDSLGYKDLKRTKGATGYNIEVIRIP